MFWRRKINPLLHGGLGKATGDLELGCLVPSLAQRMQNVASKSFHDMFLPFKGVALGTRQNTFLWKNLEAVMGCPVEPHWQGPDPETGNEGEGDCVGQSSAMCCDVLAATEINELEEREKWVAKCSVEMNYAGSRWEVGKGSIRGRGGSQGAWVAEYLNKWGVLHRIKYTEGGNTLDLTGYDPGRSREFRDRGVPDWLEPIAKKHPIKQITNVKSGEEALDAICARQPVVVCSSYAFQSKRDADGFCKPYLGRNRQKWFHAMAATGVVIVGSRIGALIQNSHGAWNSGPTPYDIPVGSFFVDLEYFDMMITDWYDCWAFSAYEGFKANKMRHRLYK